MLDTIVLHRGAIAAYEYRCKLGPAAAISPQVHRAYSAYVRSGSFGYRTRGRSFELVAGSLASAAADGCGVEQRREIDPRDCLRLRLRRFIEPRANLPARGRSLAERLRPSVHAGTGARKLGR